MSELAIVTKINKREAVVGIVGLGYVGLPLALTYARKGFRVVGFDIDPVKAEKLHRGETYIRHVRKEAIAEQVNSGRFTATTDFAKARECDALLLCVPTPLNRNREPDMQFIESTGRAIAPYVRPGQIVVLESTTYPGTTDELLRGILESKSGLVAGKDFYLAFSPEREDPGNPKFETSTIPKVVGGLTPACLEVAVALYSAAIEKVIPVSSTRAAELTKLLENIFRGVNIALVNELKLLCHKMDINIWEVIDAAATKPFGFMPFYPGPGLGGHCIPIDPFYLTWKAREFEMNTRFIELAGEINTSMPHYVRERTVHALNGHGKALRNAKVLVLGVAYKADIDDVRESPAMTVIELFQEWGAKIEYHDPYIPTTPPMRNHNLSLSSVELTTARLAQSDVVVIVTAHKSIDYQFVVDHAQLVVDSRNATRNVKGHKERIVQA